MTEEIPRNPMQDRRFGKYLLVRRLGEGGFGEVFEAVLPGAMGFAKRVAIKKLHDHLIDDHPETIHSLVNEARVGGLLNHANVVGILEFDQVEGRYYLAMEYVEGLTLSEVLFLCGRRGMYLPRFVILDLAIQVLRGLSHAHRLRSPDGTPLSLVHRDLKPSNVMVDAEGTARVLDFGVARAATNLFKTTVGSVIKGTPTYMSPEQISGERELTGQSDLFSFGAVLYEMVTHRPLFRGEDVPDLIKQIVFGDTSEQVAEAEAQFPGIGPVLERALAKEPDHRYEDARSMADDLRGLGQQYPTLADTAEVMERLLPYAERVGQGTPATRTGEAAARSILQDSHGTTGSLDVSVRADSGELANPIAAVSDGATVALAPRSDVNERSRVQAWDAFTGAFDIGMEQGARTSVLAGTPPAGTATPRPPEIPTGASLSRARRPRRLFVAVVGILALIVLAWVGVTALGSRPDPADTMAENPAAAEPASATAEVVEELPTASEPEVAPAVVEPPVPPPAVDEPAVQPVEELAREYAPGTLSLSTEPWSTIWVDHALVQQSKWLRKHPVAGGVHVVRVQCPTLGDVEKVFEVTVDGDDVSLGCWDFNTSSPCAR